MSAFCGWLGLHVFLGLRFVVGWVCVLWLVGSAFCGWVCVL